MDYKYFGADDADKCISELNRKADELFNFAFRNTYFERIRKSWDYYHGIYGGRDSYNVGFGGKNGEILTIAVNHYRNIASNMLNIVTSNRPSFQPRAVNSDAKSSIQVELASGILDYYMREKRLETHLKKATEYAIVMGAGYVKMEWDSSKGEIYDYIQPSHEESLEYLQKGEKPPEPYPIREGDVVFKTLTPYDVIFDNTKESYEDNDWILTRTFKNKFDLAAKYPDQEDDILKLTTKSDTVTSSYLSFNKTVDVPVYEFFHLKTDSLPNGRYLIYCSKDVILLDTVMPYRNLPVYRIVPSDFIGTPHGYSTMWDLLEIQDCVNALHSIVMTNQNAFGVQSIINPRGNDVRMAQVEGGMNWIDYQPVPNSPNGGKPEALQLTATPPEIFNYMQMLEKSMETISGINAISRGNAPIQGPKSGTALALMQSQALQFLSTLQQSYVQLVENVGTGLINLLKDFAQVPRIAAIAGVGNKYKLTQFTGGDISDINRIIVDMGNSLSCCLAKDTPVMLIDGSVKMVQDIKAGDLLMGPDSKQRTVRSASSGKEQMYRITSKNKYRGVDYTCNESHILSLRYCSEDYRYKVKKGDLLDITVREFLKLPMRHRRLLQGYQVGVEFEEKEVLIPSYIIGAWLGDGNHNNTSITTMDQEILQEWTNCAKRLGLKVRKDTNKNCGKASIYFITSGKQNGHNNRNPMMSELHRLNVIKNKHIPDLYLKNSRKERLELLAGLLDTDGHLVDETFVFTQKRNTLADNVVYLAKSLGFRVTHKKYTAISRLAKIPVPTVYNKVTIGGNTWEIPTRLPRKQAIKKERRDNWLNYGIEVLPVEFGTYYGFTLKEEPHFLLGDFSVSHNTTAGKLQMAEQLLQMKLITDPQKYLEVMNTGKLSSAIQGDQDELTTIRVENEALLNGSEQVLAIYTDAHAEHIKNHKSVLANPEMRTKDPNLVQRVSAHINQHLDLLRNTDPALLQMLGQQPLGPVAGSPPGPQGPQQGPGPMPGGVSGPGQAMQSPQEGGPGAMQPKVMPGSIPQPAKPPLQGPTGLPTRPQDINPNK